MQPLWISGYHGPVSKCGRDRKDGFVEVLRQYHTDMFSSRIQPSPSLTGPFVGISINDETAVLQLFAHLEGDAFNVALLMPEDKWATRNRAVGSTLRLLQFSGEIGVLMAEVRERGLTRRRGPVCICDGTTDPGG